MESKSERNIKFAEWLGNACGADLADLVRMPGDASLRTYYRLVRPDTSYVVMDAPPPENVRPFAAVASGLRQLGLTAPEILASDLSQGFLLLSDFGDATFLQTLTSQPERADTLYRAALRALSRMQACSEISGHTLPPFGREWLEREWSWHQEWFLHKWLGLTIPLSNELHAAYEALMVSALNQPQVFMHRDYHSANLMALPDGGVGILDFQDAFMGPLTYDPVSLLRDCYIDWPPEKVREWALYYAGLLCERGEIFGVSDEIYLRWFDWMGLQRHIKALLTFARKYVRDQQPRYLAFVPRTLKYITTVSAQYPELNAISEFYAGPVQQALKNMGSVCER